MMTGFDRLKQQLCEALKAHLAGAPPSVPEAGASLWQAFRTLHGARSWHPAGPNPIAMHDIAAWACLMRWPLEPHHVEAILAMDAAYLAHASGKRSSIPGRVTVSTAGAFDAMFGKEE